MNDYFVLNRGENIDWISSLYSLEYLDLTFTNLSSATNWLQVVSKLPSIKKLRLSFCNLPESLPSSLPSTNVSTSLTVFDLSRNYLPTSTVSWLLNFSTSPSSIDLQGNDVHGPILDALGNMISLEYLDFSSNKLDGGIPKSFGNMSNLMYLNLHGNHLIGQLPELIMNLSGPLQHKLQYLDLSLNNISGSIPNISRFSFLKELKLGGNRMNGSILGVHLQLPHLVFLELSLNQFTGLVPYLSYCLSLKELYLYRNMFSGTLTKSMGGLSELEVLSLGSNHLEGTITEAHFINLSKLSVLDLSANSLLTIKMNSHWIPPFQLDYMSLAHCKLGPQFPKWLRTQKHLSVLDISDVKTSDTIPSWFGSIPRTLVHLNASNNQMYGRFPEISFTNVNSSHGQYFLNYHNGLKIDLALDLSRNKISGPIHFLCHITTWTLLDLSDNLFSDQLPDCFANFTRLKYLNLANNNFSGQIPSTFGFLSALSWLHLRNNSFSGRIPTSMRNCTSLQMIDLGENRLIGKVPTWVGDNLSQVVVLSLRNNEFYGSTPYSTCRMANLQVLDLSLNRISGAIPDCLHNLTAMIQEGNSDLSLFYYAPLQLQGSFYLIKYEDVVSRSAYIMWKGKEIEYINNLELVKLIDLSSNNLKGEIPSEISALVGLVGLNFSRNSLTGSIPENIGQLRNLNFLDFSRNHLFGSIPASLCGLSSLGVLDLSYNNLSGRVPECTQLLTFNESRYVGNVGLCGLPLNISCRGDEAHQNIPKSTGDDGNAKNHLEPEDDKIVTKGFYISMGLGFVVGFWGICGIILLSSSFRGAVFKAFNTVEDYVCLRVELSKTRLRRHFPNQ